MAKKKAFKGFNLGDRFLGPSTPAAKAAFDARVASHEVGMNAAYKAMGRGGGGHAQNTAYLKASGAASSSSSGS